MSRLTQYLFECRMLPGPLSDLQYALQFEVWQPSSWLAMMTSNTQQGVLVGFMRQVQTWFNLVQEKIAPSDKLAMPDTCTLESFLATGVCAAQFTGFQPLFNKDVTIRAIVRRCTAFPVCGCECQ